MPKYTLTFLVLVTAVAACFGSTNKFLNLHDDIGSNIALKMEPVPMAYVLSTPNVLYSQDETGSYFFAFFEGFHTITCLEGEYYGYQIFVDKNDETFALSNQFHFEEMAGEEMMVHEYEDGIVYTGKAIQIIHFD